MNTLFCLRSLLNKYGSFHIAFCHRKTMKWIHCEFPSKTFSKLYEKKSYTLHRTIMHDEIVLETDLPFMYDNKVINDGIVNKCLSNKWSFTSWTSGNKSFHVHMFFPQFMKIKKPHRLKMAKQMFIRWFFEDSIDDLKVDFGLAGRHLIRAEYQLHEKTKRNKIPLVEHETDESNKLPINIILMFNKKTKRKKKMHVPTNQLPCINMLLASPLKDGKKRALFILAAHLKLFMKKEQLQQLLLLWANNKQQGKINYTHISSTLFGQYRTKQRPGCYYIKEVLRDAGLLHICEGCKNGIDKKYDRIDKI